MASPLVRELLEAGIHFGNQTANWNPKMKPYIYGKRNGIHIIDIRETLRGLIRAEKFVAKIVSNGEDVVFVGTKRQARDIVREQAERCGMPYVIERWLGGTLTNFRTIRSRTQRLDQLETLVASPEWETGYSKKMRSMLTRELTKIRRNLGGIRTMTRLPGAIIVIDVRKEHNAVREARSLEVPTVALIDTDGDPDLVSVPIPGNDDGMRAIRAILQRLADAVEEGKKARPAMPMAPVEEDEEASGGPPQRRRRGGRGRGGQPGPSESENAVTQAAPQSSPAAEAGAATPA